MTKVYIVLMIEHNHNLGNFQNLSIDETTVLGVYANKECAENRLLELDKQKRDNEAFIIQEEHLL